MASADQADSSSEDTTSSSDETDLEVIATHPQSGPLQTSNPPGAWPEASPPSGTGVTSPHSVGVLGSPGAGRLSLGRLGARFSLCSGQEEGLELVGRDTILPVRRGQTFSERRHGTRA